MAKLRGLLELMDEALNMDAAYEGVKRLGLKEGNTAADRAKAMGFEGVEYHTTTADNAQNIIEDGFINLSNSNPYRDFSNLGSRYDSPRTYLRGKGTYTSNDPFSSEFTAQAGEFEDPKAMFPLMINKSKHFDYQNPEHLKSLIAKRNEKEKLLDDAAGFGSGEVDLKDLDEIKKGRHHVMEDYMTIMNMQKRGFTGTNLKEPLNYIDNSGITTNTFNPANIRSKFAKFNPKKAGIGAGSVMSADLLANENGLLSSPDRNSILGYMADSYKYMADEGGLLGNILYSGGGKALDNLSYGTTPMKKGSGRLPSTPTNESLLNLMELFQL